MIHQSSSWLHNKKKKKTETYKQNGIYSSAHGNLYVYLQIFDATNLTNVGRSKHYNLSWKLLLKLKQGIFFYSYEQYAPGQSANKQ